MLGKQYRMLATRSIHRRESRLGNRNKSSEYPPPKSFLTSHQKQVSSLRRAGGTIMCNLNSSGVSNRLKANCKLTKTTWRLRFKEWSLIHMRTIKSPSKYLLRLKVQAIWGVASRCRASKRSVKMSFRRPEEWPRRPRKTTWAITRTKAGSEARQARIEILKPRPRLRSKSEGNHQSLVSSQRMLRILAMPRRRHAIR